MSRALSYNFTHIMDQPRESNQYSYSTPASSKMQTKPNAALYITPPEQPPYESFSQGHEHMHELSKMGLSALPRPSLPKPHNGGPSPPISPLTKATVNDNRAAAVNDIKDPILYPDIPSTPARPLFERQLSPQAQSAVSEHMTARQTTPLPAGVQPPKREEYELVISFREVLWHKFFNSTPKQKQQWLVRQRDQLREDDRARKGRGYALPATTAMRRPLMAKTPVSRSTISVRLEGSSKLVSGHRAAPNKVVKSGVPRPIRTNVSKAPRPRAGDTPTPEKKKVTQADQDFNAIPDICPPLDSLRTARKSLEAPKAENAREFTEEERPLLHLLHPAEQEVAKNLRLDPATYLTSKRRIFLARLQYFHERKAFRKTHAQQACHIDVNKASKLHTAFENVGWFDDHWFVGKTMPASV